MRCRRRWRPSKRALTRRLIVAGLLHDYGHLIRRPGEGLVGRGVDDRHEILGAEKLSAFFEEAVTMPIKLHVEAKRLSVRDRSRIREVTVAGVDEVAQASRRSALAGSRRRIRQASVR